MSDHKTFLKITLFILRVGAKGHLCGCRQMPQSAWYGCVVCSCRILCHGGWLTPATAAVSYHAVLKIKASRTWGFASSSTPPLASAALILLLVQINKTGIMMDGDTKDMFFSCLCWVHIITNITKWKWQTQTKDCSFFKCTIHNENKNFYLNPWFWVGNESSVLTCTECPGACCQWPRCRSPPRWFWSSRESHQQRRKQVQTWRHSATISSNQQTIIHSFHLDIQTRPKGLLGKVTKTKAMWLKFLLFRNVYLLHPPAATQLTVLLIAHSVAVLLCQKKITVCIYLGSQYRHIIIFSQIFVIAE